MPSMITHASAFKTLQLAGLQLWCWCGKKTNRRESDAMQATSPTSITSNSNSSSKESSSRNHLYGLLAISLVSLIFIISFASSSSSFSLRSTTASTNNHHRHQKLQLESSTPKNPHLPNPPSIAYFIYGSDGDTDRMLRLLFSVYHPRNQYLLHLDLTASQSQREELALSVQSTPIFAAVQNVNVIGKADFGNPRGSSSISSTLHAAALLLRSSSSWDWFINLSASDYPLVTQDDLLHIFSFLPKDLNFVKHSSYIGWRESQRLKRIVVDPGLYHLNKTDIFYASQKRELPKAYRLYSGSASAILSRKFLDFCILGSDNLPRALLMYLSNTPFAPNNYFQTVLCNSKEYNRTIVNDNMQYSSKDNNPPHKTEPRTLGKNDIDEMIQSGAAFATKFHLDDPVLDHIDQQYLLKRGPGTRRMVPGGWCLGDGADWEDPCVVRGNSDILRPGPGAARLEKHIVQLLTNGTFGSDQCIHE